LSCAPGAAAGLILTEVRSRTPLHPPRPAHRNLAVGAPGCDVASSI